MLTNAARFEGYHTGPASGLITMPAGSAGSSIRCLGRLYKPSLPL